MRKLIKKIRPPQRKTTEKLFFEVEDYLSEIKTFYIPYIEGLFEELEMRCDDEIEKLQIIQKRVRLIEKAKAEK